MSISWQIAVYHSISLYTRVYDGLYFFNRSMSCITTCLMTLSFSDLEQFNLYIAMNHGTTSPCTSTSLDFKVNNFHGPNCVSISLDAIPFLWHTARSCPQEKNQFTGEFMNPNGINTACTSTLKGQLSLEVESSFIFFCRSLCFDCQFSTAKAFMFHIPFQAVWIVCFVEQVPFCNMLR